MAKAETVPERYRYQCLLHGSDKTLNVQSKIEPDSLESAVPGFTLLSNFAHSPFILDGQPYASVEGFIQSLKFELPEDQQRVAAKFGLEAKKESYKLKKVLTEGYLTESDTEPVGYVSNYQDIQIPYRSEAHYDLIARAIRAKFDQNPDCKEALIATTPYRLTHDLGHPDTPITALPAEIFTTILMSIRLDYLVEMVTNEVKDRSATT